MKGFLIGVAGLVEPVCRLVERCAHLSQQGTCRDFIKPLPVFLTDRLGDFLICLGCIGQ